MKVWNETRAVLNEAQRLLGTGRALALIVLTQVKGSAFRRPGAKLLIRDDGSMLGNVSGGCLENDLRERALAAIKSGRPDKIHYATGSDEDVIWGLGLGCDGELDLLIYPVTAGSSPAWLATALAHIHNRTPFVIHWPLDPSAGTSPVVRDDSVDPGKGEFRDPMMPPPELFVVGAGDDAIPLVKLAAEAGLYITVIDHRSGYLDEQRFPDAHRILNVRPESAGQKMILTSSSFVVIKNHALEMDKKWARFFAGTPALYIGILGPKKRCREVRAHMEDKSADRIFGPAGLDIGSEGAEQIAISIIAEMLAIWSGRHPIHLRDREGSIH